MKIAPLVTAVAGLTALLHSAANASVTLPPLTTTLENGHAWIQFYDFIPERQPAVGYDAPSLSEPPPPVRYLITFNSTVPVLSAQWDTGTYVYENFHRLDQNGVYHYDGGVDYFSDFWEYCPGSLCKPAVVSGNTAYFTYIDKPTLDFDGYFETSTWTRGSMFAAEVDPSNISSAFSLTISSIVPEPETWALLTLGFFGLGLLLRKNREAGVPSRVRLTLPARER